jgi:PhnB protein
MQFVPYLAFDGDCEEAFGFYARCLGAKVVAMIPHAGTPAEGEVPPEWRQKIIHACLEWDGHMLMGGDAPPGQYVRPEGFSVSLHVPDVEQAERLFAALSQGGEVRMPLAETFWALRFGMLVDRHGVPWMVNCPRPA